jgi:hypothetical protein
MAMQANRLMRAVPATNLVTKLFDYVDERLYGGRAGRGITFDQTAPRSNPFVAGYTRQRPLRVIARPGDFSVVEREERRAA